jgi:hypothetical protein
MISIGHRRSLEAYHQRLITFEKESGQPGVIKAEASDNLESPPRITHEATGAERQEK